jgi:hypothetical protein
LRNSLQVLWNAARRAGCNWPNRAGLPICKSWDRSLPRARAWECRRAGRISVHQKKLGQTTAFESGIPIMQEVHRFDCNLALYFRQGTRSVGRIASEIDVHHKICLNL